MSLAEISLRTIAYSIVVIPIVIFVIGAILYHYRPIYRRTVGIVLVTLGSLGIPIFSIVLYISLVRGSSNLGLFLYSSMVAIEVLSFGLGIISLTKRKVPILG
jgi:hypothetical protein